MEDNELLNCLSLRERKRILKNSLSFKFPTLRLCRDSVSNKLCLESYRFVLYDNNTFYVFRRHFKNAQAHGLMTNYQIVVNTAGTQNLADKSCYGQNSNQENEEINRLANKHFHAEMENVYGKIYSVLKREHQKREAEKEHAQAEERVEKQEEEQEKIYSQEKRF